LEKGFPVRKIVYAAFTVLALAGAVVVTLPQAEAVNCTSYRVGQYTYTNCY